MGMYKYLKKLRKSPEFEKMINEKLISWRKEPVVIRIEKPTKLDRARSLGYKAKQGFILTRIRIGKGSSKREMPSGGRKPGNVGMKKITPGMNLQHIAETRVAKKFPNLEVLNSYYIAEDGKSKWFEIILVDPNHSCIKNDPKLNWICKPAHKKRVFRGLTAAGKKSRRKN